MDAQVLEERENRFEGATEPRGAAGSRVMAFQALRVGHTKLLCEYRRAWEQESAERFEVDVDIVE